MDVNRRQDEDALLDSSARPFAACFSSEVLIEQHRREERREHEAENQQRQQQQEQQQPPDGEDCRALPPEDDDEELHFLAPRTPPASWPLPAAGVATGGGGGTGGAAQAPELAVGRATWPASGRRSSVPAPASAWWSHAPAAAERAPRALRGWGAAAEARSPVPATARPSVVAAPGRQVRVAYCRQEPLPQQPADREGEGELLEAQLALQETELRRWRNALAARGQEAAGLSHRLEEVDREATAETLRLASELASLRARLRAGESGLRQVVARREAERERCAELVAAKERKVWALKEKARALHEKHQHLAIASARDGGALGARQRLLEERQRRVATLRAQASKLEATRERLDGDLQSALTFMFRKLMKSAGPKARDLDRAAEHYSGILCEWVGLSEPGRELLDGCATRALRGGRSRPPSSKASLAWGEDSITASPSSVPATPMTETCGEQTDTTDGLSVSVRCAPLAKCRARWDRCAASGGVKAARGSELVI
uniref:Uncharacterized protein n=1 Tax=Alexandrium monilatum TaxID=311494 RepID=A0A7S4V584_9DINO